MTNTAHQALQRAVDHCGSLAELARRCGTSRQRLDYALHSSRRGTPAELLHAVSAATGGAVSPCELRPDLFPDSDIDLPLTMEAHP